MRYILTVLASLLISGSAISYNCPSPCKGTSNATNFGVYFWGNVFPPAFSFATNSVSFNPNNVVTAYHYAKTLGLKTVRIELGADFLGAFKYWIEATCVTNTNLTDFVKSRQDLQLFLNDPQFTTIIFTAYDWAALPGCSGSDKRFLDISYWPGASQFYTGAYIKDLRPEVKQEYQNFATYLGTTFPNKTFLIGDWEADNQLYGGCSFCLNPGPGGQPTDVLFYFESYIAWMNAKIQGIRAANVSNVKVFIEMNDPHHVEDLGYFNVLNNILPKLEPIDYVSYSAWASTNVSGADEQQFAQFAYDIDFINQRIQFSQPGAQLFIGELGVPGSFTSGDYITAKKLKVFQDIAFNAGVPYAIIWDLFADSFQAFNYGSFNETGAITAYGLQATFYSGPIIPVFDIETPGPTPAYCNQYVFIYNCNSEYLPTVVGP